MAVPRLPVLPRPCSGRGPPTLTAPAAGAAPSPVPSSSSNVHPNHQLGSPLRRTSSTTSHVHTLHHLTRPGGSKHYEWRRRTTSPRSFPHSLPLPPRLRPQAPANGLSGCVRAGTLWSPALRTSSLAAISHSMLLGPAASREGFAEGGGAGRLEVSDPPVPRETGAGCVTARRPPGQRAGLETDSAPDGSTCVA